MTSPLENVSMALFCDFENVALGVRDAKYDKFDIKRVLERLLLKGSIVVKKAYCDWDRYKSFKAAMHEANFELIEIPHVRQSGKNSADIRLVVDALDLCYTKAHVNTFVIISGDSDFSPLVSKLRENAKQVIGVGVKQSTSDLLIANCDEFIFYDDLVRESQRTPTRRESAEAQPAARRSPEEEARRRDEVETRRSQAVTIAVETFDALLAERGDSGKIWASMLKEAIKRRKPDFNESYYGFRAFGNLLEEAQARRLLELGRDEKSGTYVFRGAASAEPERSREPRLMSPTRDAERVRDHPSASAAATVEGAQEPGAASLELVAPVEIAATVEQPAKSAARRRSGGAGRKRAAAAAGQPTAAEASGAAAGAPSATGNGSGPEAGAATEATTGASAGTDVVGQAPAGAQPAAADPLPAAEVHQASSEMGAEVGAPEAKAPPRRRARSSAPKTTEKPARKKRAASAGDAAVSDTTGAVAVGVAEVLPVDAPAATPGSALSDAIAQPEANAQPDASTATAQAGAAGKTTRRKPATGARRTRKAPEAGAADKK